MEILLTLCLVLLVAVLVLLIVLITKSKPVNYDQVLGKISDETGKQQSQLRSELVATTQASIKNMGEMMGETQRVSSATLENRLKTFSMENEQKLDLIRKTMENRLTYLQNDNNKQLEEMRKTVDQHLQTTLENKMTQSFALVNDRLEQVYKGLGEMQNLAVGVGDLKKVLSNVKTRGILGEIQLEAILSEIFTKDQYDTNVATKKGSKNVVEFGIKLPSKEGEFIYLPIDSKFPADCYSQLREAMEKGEKEEISQASKNLVARIKSEAKDIRDKYIDPPNTTDFAIMFLPFEGLYCEAVNLGLIEILQRDYKVNIAGPSTMAALLNSLQMGFRTLAVQKRSSEVWKVLGEVKTEFEKFNQVLESTQQRLNQANSELDKLVGVRTRQIQNKLSNMEKLSPDLTTKVD